MAPLRLKRLSTGKSASAKRLAERDAQKVQKKAARKATTEENEPLVTWSLRLPKSIHAALRRMAKAEGRSATKQVEMLIRQAIDRSQKVAIPTSTE